MTCIIALKNKGEVYMGSDSACSHGGMIQNLAESKTFTRDGVIIGSTGYVRPGQVLRYSYRWPAVKQDIDHWLFNEFIPGWQDALKQSKNLEVSDEQATQDAAFLIGVRGRIFEMDHYFEVVEVRDDYHAVGCGTEIALGVMYATQKRKLKPEERILLALNAASYHMEGVRAPFHVGKV